MNDGPDYQQLYEVADDQAGYFTARQGRDCGLSWERLSSNVANGRFLRVRHGIYRLAQYPGSAFEDLFVAWLRTGPDSVISHESALSLFDLSDNLSSEVHVIVSRTASRRRPGIRLHTNRLERREITRRAGLPVTTVPRTLADVAAAGMAEEQVRLALREAVGRGLTSGNALQNYAQKRGGRFRKILSKSISEGDLR